MRSFHIRVALTWMPLLLAAGAAVAAPPNSLSPTTNMCQRWNHQSTIKNNILYIDGGIETFVPYNSHGSAKGNITVGTNNYLIQVDMSQSWNWQKANNLSETFVEKTANPATGTSPPQVIRGALYSGAADDSRIYLYGGSTSGLNTSFPGFQYQQSAQYSLWSYDTKSQVWDQYDTTLETPQRPNAGASVEAPDQGLAFFYNGQIDNGTSLATVKMNETDEFLPGMVVIDTANRSTRNVSTPNNSSAGNPVSRAQMAYLPGIGEKGILVSIGGSWKNTTEVDSTEIGTMVPMNTVTIFDIASLDNGGDGVWYGQQTSGDTPLGRVDHCVVAVSAPDNSSHQISVYGGRSSETGLIDDVWTLSLPAFQWTKLYSGSSARYGHSCHVVGNRQMLTVGGALNSPNNITHGCDWELKGVAIWDMSLRQWGQVFDADAALYVVPDLVTRDIGGTGTGGANFTKPVNGFSSQDLATLFQTTRSWPGANSTSSSSMQSAPNLSTGAIAGIVVGAIACCLLIIGACFIYYIRRLRHRISRAGSSQSNRVPLAEADGSEVQEKDGLSMHSDSSDCGQRRSQGFGGYFAYKHAVTANRGAPAELQSPDSGAAAELYSPDEKRVHEIGSNSHHHHHHHHHEVAELPVASTDSLYQPRLLPPLPPLPRPGSHNNSEHNTDSYSYSRYSNSNNSTIIDLSGAERNIVNVTSPTSGMANNCMSSPVVVVWKPLPKTPSPTLSPFSPPSSLSRLPNAFPQSSPSPQSSLSLSPQSRPSPAHSLSLSTPAGPSPLTPLTPLPLVIPAGAGVGTAISPLNTFTTATTRQQQQQQRPEPAYLPAWVVQKGGSF